MVVNTKVDFSFVLLAVNAEQLFVRDISRYYVLALELGSAVALE